MKTLVQQAQDKKYADFDSQAKAILSQKVATALADSGYFDRLNQAKGIQEDEEIKGDFKKMKKDAGTEKEKEDEKELAKDLEKEKEEKEEK